MKRRFALVTALALVLLSLFAGIGLAHDVTMSGAVTLKGDQVAIRLLDALNSPIPGAQVSVAVGLPDQKPDKPVQLTEGPKGTYKGAVSQPPVGDVYVLTFSVTTPAGDVHEALVRAARGQDLPELMTSLLPVPVAPKGTNWGIYIYIAAAIVLATATVVALLRRRAPGDEEG